MAPPLARTAEEAHLYMELHPCPCGEVDFGTTSSLSEVAGQWICRYAGRCVECGRPRAFEFRQPEEPRPAPEDGWADGTDPSELLDAGQWLWVADVYGSVPADPDGLSAARLEQARTDLRAAAAAIREVLKFLPDGATEVPDSAFWSDQGRRVRATDPGRFGRLRLRAAERAYARLLTEWPRPHGDDG